MQTKEIKQLSRAIWDEFQTLAKLKECPWISEEAVLKEFPFGSKDILRKMRADNTLEFDFHWKYLSGHSKGKGRGRSASVIYHRQRMIEYFDNL